MKQSIIQTQSTKKKTLQNVAVLQQFLASKNEERKLEEIPPEELNEYLSEFIITVRTKDKQEECWIHPGGEGRIYRSAEGWICRHLQAFQT